MPYETLNRSVISDLAALAQRVDELILLCDQLGQDNQTLRARQAALQEERDQLLQQNRHLRARIEAIVARLRGLEKAL